MALIDSERLDWATLEHGDTQFRRKRLAVAAGGEDLGCSLYELPPGRKSWPYHYHEGNEEAIFVLAGEGTLRLDGDEYPLTGGDYAALPTGEGGAHRVINDGDSNRPLRYLVVSTMRVPDLTVYPDSEKVGIFAGEAPGSGNEPTLKGFYRLTDTVDYWEGEE